MAKVYLSMAEKRRHDFNNNNRNRAPAAPTPSPGKLSQNSSKPLPIGAKVWVNVSHPNNRSTIYLCEARVIRTPRFKGETRYKVLVSGARPFSEKESVKALKQLLGMKIVRDISLLYTEEPWVYGKGTDWFRMEEDDAQYMVRLSVNRIRREPARQSRNNSIKKLF